MNGQEIRRLFSDFFAERGHRRVPSSSLIPPPDERTLLFTNAGMNQMKPYFMGMAEPPARRMTSVQKCFRTSDIEEVGDASHCTFFEMLGNFSVGDYFKDEVIPWAWELLTSPQPQGMGFAKQRIWTTVYLDDDESFELWRGVGIPPQRIVRFDESENYWFMIKGGAGPCGPNTEIYYDFGPEQGCGQPDCAPPTHDCGRFVELWNLVFMTLYQEEDGKTRRPLPMKNVDTGGGLERWAAASLWQEGVDWQGKPRQWEKPPSIFDTDLFRPILEPVETMSGVNYDQADHEHARGMRIVAEHVRAASLLIADGVTPSNEGRGYVLRRLIRRAIFYGTSVYALGSYRFMEPTSRAVGMHMAGAYPELLERAAFISQTMDLEEKRFIETLGRGRSAIKDLEEFRGILVDWLRAVADRDEARYRIASRRRPLSDLYYSTGLPEQVKSAYLQPMEDTLGDQWWLQEPSTLRESTSIAHTLSGDAVFILWDTFGFPPELTKEVASSNKFQVQESRFDELMEEQRARSRAAAHFQGDAERIQTYSEMGLSPTEFVGYETTRAFGSVASILLDGATIVREVTPQLAEGHRVEVTLDQTPFYPEGGGQIGDRGEILWPGGRFLVEDTQSIGEGGVIAHIGRIESGTLSMGDPVESRVDESLRADTMRNHTGTHILHAALRKVLGPHVRQAGSLVGPERLRFDCTHLEALTPQQIAEVESLANRVVRENLTVHVEHKSYEEALEEGALAFFGDKYADIVRVVGVCDVELHDCFSHELCGGTHVHASGEVGSIIITGETSIGAGLRRIEAVTGRAAAERVRAHEALLSRIGALLQAPGEEIESRVAALRDENERLRKEIESTRRRTFREAFAQRLVEGASEVAGVKFVVAPIDSPPSTDVLRALGDEVRSGLKSCVILLGGLVDGKPAFLAMSTPDVSQRVSAGDVVRAASREAGGGGGGRPELAQGGGNDASKLDAALAAGRKLIEERLQA